MAGSAWGGQRRQGKAANWEVPTGRSRRPNHSEIAEKEKRNFSAGAESGRQSRRARESPRPWDHGEARTTESRRSCAQARCSRTRRRQVERVVTPGRGGREGRETAAEAGAGACRRRVGWRRIAADAGGVGAVAVDGDADVDAAADGGGRRRSGGRGEPERGEGPDWTRQTTCGERGAETTGVLRRTRGTCGAPDEERPGVGPRPRRRGQDPGAAAAAVEDAGRRVVAAIAGEVGSRRGRRPGADEPGEDGGRSPAGPEGGSTRVATGGDGDPPVRRFVGEAGPRDRSATEPGSDAKVAGRSVGRGRRARPAVPDGRAVAEPSPKRMMRREAAADAGGDEAASRRGRR
jgi:hypothetical protein